MSHIVFDSITKSFGTNRVLDGCTLEVEKGEVMTLLGPSGCGKTTLLRTLAGFSAPDSGRVRIGGREITDLPANRRSVGYVFQNYALFPHLTVADNVAYGLRVRRRPRAEIDHRVVKALELVSLAGLGDRFPAELSGGQQQRVAIARVLVLEPDVLLLDEPFNALDAKLRLTMQTELRKLIQRLGITAIFVTHDQEEAMLLSDKVAVMQAGVIEQVAAPIEIYDRPATPYVANFIGRANVLPVTVAAGRVTLFPAIAADRPDGPARLIVRPESLHLVPDGTAARVTFATALGPTIDYEMELAGGEPLRVSHPRRAGERPLDAGSMASVAIADPAACRVVEPA
jgi:ABC-type Fe3+/spermidine/putrescine transport system ATPase subunit